MVDLVSSLGFRVNCAVGMAKIGSETLDSYRGTRSKYDRDRGTRSKYDRDRGTRSKYDRDRGIRSKYDRDAIESPIVQGLEMTQTTWVPRNTISRCGVQDL